MHDLLRQRPWLPVLLGAALTSLAFPGTTVAGLCLLGLLAAVGVGAVAVAPTVRAWAPRPSAAWAGGLAVAVVVLFGVAVFAPAVSTPLSWTMGDWGCQHAALTTIMADFPSTTLPTWTHAVSTGDSPFELYPALSYLLVAAVAHLGGWTDHLATALTATAIAAHVGIAVGTTRLALRVGSAPVAAAIGVAMLVDKGTISAGGVSGIVEWGLLHSAVAQVFTLAAVVALLDHLARPRLGRTVAIWVWTALACAAHPSALLGVAGVAVALGLVALLAVDVPPRRALIGAAHLALGVALAAVVWAPLGARLIEYGQHFSAALRSPGRLLEDVLAWPHPFTQLAGVVYAGYVGLAFALVSRRAAPTLLAASAAVYFAAFTDAPYLVLDLGPSLELARLGADRLYALLRPMVYAGGAVLAAELVRAAGRGWAGASGRRRQVAGALAAITLALAGRALVPAWQQQRSLALTTATAQADPSGQALLVAWAQARAAEQRPDAFARALFDLGGAHYSFHLTAETGLPTLHMGPIPDMLLRERIEDTSPASLHRFNIRWVIARDSGHPAGDPATEQRFGPYVVREVPGWDGRFARVEAGAGQVRVVTLRDDRVEVELTGTDAPALVSFGMGYYPRWRARALGEDGQAVPLGAVPTIPGGALHVVAGWLPPGRTVLTPDGPLPSDGAGRGLAGAALLLAVGIIVVWSRPRWQRRVLRRYVAVRAQASRLARRALAAPALTVATAVVVLGLGYWQATRPARTVAVGVGLRGEAEVRARAIGGPWQDCRFAISEGRHTCGDLGTVADAVHTVLNDAQPGWPFTSPVIKVVADAGPIEIEVRRRLRLAGTYRLRSIGADAELRVDDGPAHHGSEPAAFELADGQHTVRLRAVVSTEAWIAVVRADTLEPPRPYLRPPPAPAP
ncbi:MAG: hypothetical protein KA190_26530 [Kofleriaceae bacterium]|nr:hypothetical protein [Kofleriaceae bacterium]